MFFTYLRRELRRRIRQATFIALGLAEQRIAVACKTARADWLLILEQPLQLMRQR